jgi:hypothetical protein
MGTMRGVTDIKMGFFDMSIGNIYRAIQGRAYLGAFTLTMASIDAMAYLEYATDKNDRNGRTGGNEFKQWAKDNLTQKDETKAEILWGCRCGLMHALGFPSDATRDGIITNYSYTHDHPERHWERQGDGHYRLNLESLAAEVTVEAYKVFTKREQQEKDDPEKVQQFVKNGSRMVFASGETPKRFADLQCLDRIARNALAYLDSLDQENPCVETLIEEIRNIYPPSDRRPLNKQISIMVLCQDGLSTSGPTSGPQ